MQRRLSPNGWRRHANSDVTYRRRKAACCSPEAHPPGKTSVPSIEIVCIGQTGPIDFSHLSFAVESGRELVSHRIPRPLFRKDFASLTGCIYHLGNPDLKIQKTRRMFFAWDLLSDRVRSSSRPTFLEFRPEFMASMHELLGLLMESSPVMHELLGLLMESSPVRQLLFTSDW